MGEAKRRKARPIPKPGPVDAAAFDRFYLDSRNKTDPVIASAVRGMIGQGAPLPAMHGTVLTVDVQDFYDAALAGRIRVAPVIARADIVQFALSQDIPEAARTRFLDFGYVSNTAMLRIVTDYAADIDAGRRRVPPGGGLFVHQWEGGVAGYFAFPSLNGGPPGSGDHSFAAFDLGCVRMQDGPKTPALAVADGVQVFFVNGQRAVASQATLPGVPSSMMAKHSFENTGGPTLALAVILYDPGTRLEEIPGRGRRVHAEAFLSRYADA